MNARAADPIAVRVARRHQSVRTRVVVPPQEIRATRIESGTIFGIEVKLLVEPLVGYLRNFRFRPAVNAIIVAWEGMSETGERVSGRLVMHVAVGENEVASWGEVTVESVP